jgi:hypothetical protein
MPVRITNEIRGIISIFTKTQLEKSMNPLYGSAILSNLLKHITLKLIRVQFFLGNLTSISASGEKMAPAILQISYLS